MFNNILTSLSRVIAPHDVNMEGPPADNDDQDDDDQPGSSAGHALPGGFIGIPIEHATHPYAPTPQTTLPSQHRQIHFPAPPPPHCSVVPPLNNKRGRHVEEGDAPWGPSGRDLNTNPRLPKVRVVCRAGDCEKLIKDREMQISELAAALDVANKDTEKVRKELDDVKTGMPEASVPVDWLAAQITHVKDQLADAQEERDKGKQDLDRLKQEIVLKASAMRKMEAELSELKSSETRLPSAPEELQKQLEERDAHIVQLQRDLEKATAEAAQTKGLLAEATGEIATSVGGEGVPADPRITELESLLEAAEATADGIQGDLAEAVEAANNLTLRHDAILKEKESLFHDLEKQLAEKSDELLQLQSSHAASAAYANMVNQDNGRKASQVNQLDAVKLEMTAELEKKAAELRDRDVELAELKAQHDRLIADATKQRNSMGAELFKLEESLKQKELESSDRQKRISDLEAEIRVEVGRERQQHAQEIEKLSGDNAAAVAQLREREAAQAVELNALKAQAATVATEDHARLTNALKAKQDELSSLTAQVRNLQSARSRLEQEHAAAVRTEKDVQEKLKMERDSALVQAKEAKQKLELEMLRNRHALDERTARVDRAQRDLETKTQELSEMTRRQEELVRQCGNVEALQHRLDEIVNERDTLLQAAAERDQSLNLERRRASHLADQVSRLTHADSGSNGLPSTATNPQMEVDEEQGDEPAALQGTSQAIERFARRYQGQAQRSPTPMRERRASVSIQPPLQFSRRSSFTFPNPGRRLSTTGGVGAPVASSATETPAENQRNPPSSSTAPRTPLPPTAPDTAPSSTLPQSVRHATPGPSLSQSGTPASDAITQALHRMEAQIQELRSAVGSQNSLRTASQTGHGPFQASPSKRYRDPERTLLTASIRKALNLRLGIKKDDDIIGALDNIWADEEDLRLFMEDAIVPGLEPLRVIWNEPKNAWNDYIAQRFTQQFIQEQPEYHGEEEAIMSQFFQRINTLRKRLSPCIPRHGEDSAAVERRVAARDRDVKHGVRMNKRKHTLHNNRLQITREGADLDGPDQAHWTTLYNMVDQLGINGESSDESDGETYTVKIKNWRSEEVQQRLKFIDRNRRTTTLLGTIRPGSQPHERTRSRLAVHSTRPAVPGLPRNFYGDAWYNSLKPLQQHQLDALDEVELPPLEVTQ